MTMLLRSIFQLAEIAKQINKQETITTKPSELDLQNSKLHYQLNSVSLSLVYKTQEAGTSLAVQQLRLCSSTTGGTGSIPGRGTKIPHATWHGQKNKNKTQDADQERMET